MRLQRLLQILWRVVPDVPLARQTSRSHALKERPEARPALVVGTHTDNPDRPPVEVTLDRQDHGLARRDPLLLVTPLPGELEGRLDRLGTGVHRQHHVKAKHLGHLLGEWSEAGRVEGAGREGELGGLGDKGLDWESVWH